VSSAAPGHAAPAALDELARRLGAVVERSPADETEVLWLETLAGEAVAGGAGTEPGPPPRQRTVQVQVRVRERGRTGFHRTGLQAAGSAVPRELDAAVRFALGQARLAPPGPPLPLAGPGGHRAAGEDLHDPAVAALDAATARDLLEAGRREGERLSLGWHELRLAVANSRGLAHGVEATALTLAVRCGDGPGAGRAAGSARILAALAAPEIVERARRRAAGGASAEPVPEGPLPVLLAAEAVALLVPALADATLSSRAFLDGLSWFAGRIGEAVLDPAFSLLDDGTDPSGLPFPMDCDGWPKRPVPLIEAGVLASPAVDAELGRRLGRTPTPHAVGFDESRPGNLFVAAGGDAGEALLAAAEGGLWIGALDELRIVDPTTGAFRARAAGVRRIEGGALAAPVPDLRWRGDLAAAFGLLAAVGRGEGAVTLAVHGAWGGCRAPALVLPAVAGLEPAGGG
jgi:PmbA protein